MYQIRRICFVLTIVSLLVWPASDPILAQEGAQQEPYQLMTPRIPSGEDTEVDVLEAVVPAAEPVETPQAAVHALQESVFLPFLQAPSDVDAAAKPDVALNAVEITQGIQSLRNDVPLVAGKVTVARIYATTNSATPARNIYLTLKATRNGVALPGSPIRSNPRVVFPNRNRGSLGSSFNFWLPSSWTQGNVTFTAELRRGDGITDGNLRNNRSTFSIKFVAVPTLDYMIVPVNYTHAPSGRVYSPPAQEKITLWISRVFPVPGIRVRYHAPVTFRGDLSEYNDFKRLLQQITDLRTSENAPRGRAYYGLFTLPPMQGPYIAGLGWLGLRAAVGININDVAGHELGHNFGREHAPCGYPDGPDPNYPHAGATIGQYGLNTGTKRIWPPATTDFMSYCAPAWTSAYTYRGLLTDQIDYGMAAAEAPDSHVLWVRAVLHEDGSAEFLPPYSLMGSLDVAPADAACHVRLLGDAGQALAEHPVQVAETADGEPLRYVSAMLPLPAEPVQAVTLVCDGQEAARTEISAVAAAAASPQVRQDDAALTLEWDAAGGPALVQYRRQSDPIWSTLGVDLTEGVLTMDPDDLPGGTLEFRVVRAGNAEAAVELAAVTAGIDLPDKPPRVWISGPEAASSENPIILLGHGFDAEDGVLDNLSWFVNGVPAGNDPDLQLTVPASGAVEVTLSATDAAGQTTVAVHSVEVTQSEVDEEQMFYSADSEDLTAE